MTRFTITALVALSLFAVACGGRQTPPSSGSCRAGREWVPPHEENGTMQDGYCRNRE